jgi:hypothetical protein
MVHQAVHIERCRQSVKLVGVKQSSGLMAGIKRYVFYKLHVQKFFRSLKFVRHFLANQNIMQNNHTMTVDR